MAGILRSWATLQNYLPWQVHTRPSPPCSLVASRTVAEHRQRLLSFKDEVAFDTNFANLPEAPGNKETVLAIAPALKQAITASVNGTCLEVKVRPGCTLMGVGSHS